ncbi:carbamoyl phosphate synthase small subunit [Weissella diestrammenae]|uniref:Carbamoyl phosphate synthase small chain n=1 Tax=Weissella diestrammenae TaxID=1162633 RepID=A0A7G9T420_9LACO|nr:carbamoyl phosphate synthase small subunit [Weissella diestrammenae]MCM0583044.1 carbamoyl phosphate synthase small subunit [Weissella diestrammenae]QNN74845.1 carbamoyl phosphate synthase small subunit [Weissella diestrammenae]
MQRYLVLENGSIYEGEAFGAAKMVTGELVFNTGMTGYQESLTDLSYHGQILMFTYPLIGNYGINRDDFESLQPAATALVVREVARRPANWRSQMSLAEWAEKMDLPGISGVDTRALTRELREHGVMKAILVDANPEAAVATLKATDLSESQVLEVTAKSPYVNPTAGISIALIDFGLKHSILRALAKRGVNVMVFPATVTAQTIIDANPDGILLSNGPGDPESVAFVLPVIRELQAHFPLMGICLGHQLFAMANGAKTYKLKFGHRGFNHAVLQRRTGKIDFTSQNHGYAVDPKSLTETDLEITHEEINDHTIEGLALKGHAAFSVQFHPDAAPGPHDAEYLFDDFIALIQASQKGLTHAEAK